MFLKKECKFYLKYKWPSILSNIWNVDLRQDNKELYWMRKTLGLLYWAPKSPVAITLGYTNNSIDAYTVRLTEYQSQKPPIKLKL